MSDFSATARAESRNGGHWSARWFAHAQVAPKWPVWASEERVKNGVFRPDVWNSYNMLRRSRFRAFPISALPTSSWDIISREWWDGQIFLIKIEEPLACVNLRDTLDNYCIFVAVESTEVEMKGTEVLRF